MCGLVRVCNCCNLTLGASYQTPANVYMFTHGATMFPGELPMSFHAVRGALQVVSQTERN